MADLIASLVRLALEYQGNVTYEVGRAGNHNRFDVKRI